MWVSDMRRKQGGDSREEVGDMDVFYEIMCRGKQKCGTFVSSEFVNQCPKCGEKKIMLREVRKKLGNRRSDKQARGHSASLSS